MSGKNKKQKFKRKFISLEEKIGILDRIKCGEKSSSIAKSLNLNEATIRTILTLCTPNDSGRWLSAAQRYFVAKMCIYRPSYYLL